MLCLFSQSRLLYLLVEQSKFVVGICLERKVTMEILCYLITSYSNDIIILCVIVNLTNVWIAKIGAEPDKFIIGMLLLGLVLMALLAILVLLGFLTNFDMFSGCLQDVFR